MYCCASRLLLRCCSVHVVVPQYLLTPACVVLVGRMSTSVTSVGEWQFQCLVRKSIDILCCILELSTMMNVIRSCVTLVATASMLSLRPLSPAKVVLPSIQLRMKKIGRRYISSWHMKMIIFSSATQYIYTVNVKYRHFYNSFCLLPADADLYQHNTGEG